MADFLKKLPDGASGTSLAQEAVGVGDLNRVIGVLNGTDGPVGANFFALNPAPQAWAKLLASRKASNPGVAGLPVLMANPPALSLSTANAATSVAGSALRAFVSGTNVVQAQLFTLEGGPPTMDTINHRLKSSWTEEGVTWGAINWITDAPKFELLMFGAGVTYRLSVNGQIATPTQQSGSHTAGTSTWVAGQIVPANGSSYRLLVDWTGFPASQQRALRQYRCEFAIGFPATGGLQMVVTDTLVGGPRRGPRVIVVGDSFSEGTGSIDKCQDYVQTLSWLMGWDCWALAEGGTGYLQDNVPSSRTNALGHVQDVYNNSPDAVLWALGINDSGFTGAQITAQAQLCYAAVAAQLPQVPQIVLGPFWGTGLGGPPPTQGNWITARNALQAAALAAGLPFADPMGTGYLYGSGRVGATTGDGPADFLVSSVDTTHPSPQGHDTLARVIATTVSAALGG